MLKKSLSMLVSIVLLLPALVFAEYSFVQNTRIDDASQGDQWTYVGGSLAYTNGNIYAAWTDRRNTEDIYFAKSTDGGTTFGQNIKVNDNSAGTLRTGIADIATDKSGQYVYVLYRVPDDESIHLARSTDGGETFEPSINVEKRGCRSYYEGGTSMTTDNDGNVYVVWEERGGGGCSKTPGIYLAKSTNHGKSFNKKVLLRKKTHVSIDFTGWLVMWPDVAVDDAGNIYAAWMDDYSPTAKIVVAVSTDGGSSFSHQTAVDASYIPQDHPKIIARGNGDVWVSWQDGRGINIAHSTDMGQTFLPTVKVNDLNNSAYPSIAQGADGKIYIAYFSFGDNDWWTTGGVYMTWSEDNGATFKPSVKVSDQPISLPGDAAPSIAISEQGQAYVNWTDTRNGGYDIYFAASNIP